MRMASNSQENKTSSLLLPEENEIVFSLLGPKCVTLATTVAELYFSRGRYGDYWQLKDMGVLCLVKDNYKRSYFFRLYCPVQKKLLWEHEVYNNLDYLVLESYLHVFEAEDCITGFNFADEEEGGFLRKVLLHKLECKRQKRERKRVANNTVGPRKVENGYLPTQTSVTVPVKDVYSKKDAKKKLTKADIGSPLNFRHVSHVGWDPQRGFEVDKVEDPELIEFFNKAGVSENHLKDRETREFIYDFILKNGGMDAVKEDITEVRKTPPTRGRAPPPPPSRAPPATPPPPPPPPPIRTLPPRINPQSINKTTAKPTAAVAPLASSAPPPPPPPPGPPPPPLEPPTSNDDPRSALMQAIRSGTTLKPVSGLSNETKKQSDSRGELMDQIRQGIELKSVSSTNHSQPPPQAVQENSLAGALARALAERSKAIYSDSSDTSDGEGEDEWEDP